MMDDEFDAWREATNKKVREIDSAIEILQRLRNMYLSESYTPGVSNIVSYREWKPIKWLGED
jgi:hypothetical protein